MGASITSALLGASPVEVPLADAPLVRVIAQVRFAEVLSIESPETAGKFQSAIQENYPVLVRDQGFNIQFPIAGAGPAQPRPMTYWRFSDAPGVAKWRITLTSQFLTIEALRYTSRNDFLDRFEALLDVLQVLVKPSTVLRLGVRHINRIEGKDLNSVSALFRPEVTGVLATAAFGDIRHSQTETLFSVQEEECQLAMRCGKVPPNAIVEGFDIAFNDPWYLLDFDVFDDRPVGFSSAAVASRARAFAARSYSVFRWAVTDQFMIRFGAKNASS